MLPWPRGASKPSESSYRRKVVAGCASDPKSSSTSGGTSISTAMSIALGLPL